MTSIINIKIPNSTQNKPTRFFEEFSDNSSIELAKASFLSQFPNGKENDRWNSFPNSISPDGQYFTIEYETPVEYNDTGEVVKKRWKPIEYRFESELFKLLKSEYEKSIFFLSSNLDSRTDKYETKEWLANLILKLINSIKIINFSVNFKQYQTECREPYFQIVQYIYRRYPLYAPKSSLDEMISEILHSGEKTKPLYKPDNLSINVCEKIIGLLDIKGKLVFPFWNPGDEKDKLKYFLYGQFEKIKTPIAFSKNITAAYYLIYMLAKYSGYSSVQIRKANILLMGENSFNEKSLYTAINRFPANNPDLQNRIDQMIFSCLE